MEQFPLFSEAMIDLRRRKRKIGLSILLLFIYILIMPLIGFVLSTLLYVAGFIFVLEERRRLVLALSPVLVAGLVILIFSKFITMPFPRGLGIFASFSRLFY
jgi:putative tricarboxylic transport membrane protein